MGKAVDFPVQQGQSLPQRVGDILGQAVTQVGPGDAGLIGGTDGAHMSGRTPLQKVPHQLRRCAEPTAAQQVGAVLPLLLEPDAGQYIPRPKIRWVDPHQEAAVDVLPVPGTVAHAVGD